MSDRIPERADIPEKSRWSINDIYKNDELWEDDYKKAMGYAEKIAGFKGKLCSSAEDLLDYCRLDDELTVLLDKLINYSQRKSDEDTRVSKYQDMSNRLGMLYVTLSDAAAFAAPEILSVSDETLSGFFEDDPELKLYKRAIERIRIKRGHILSENEEKILALAGEMTESPDTIFSMFNDADLTFPDAVDKDGNVHQVTHESHVAYMRSSDRVLRKSSFESVHQTYGKFKNTCAATLSSQIKSLVFNARARKYTSTLEAALSANEVDTEVYRRLIKSVRENLEPLHRYIKIHKKALGTDEFHAYDLSAPCVKDIDLKIPFEKAVEEVYASLEPMGGEYRAIFKKAIDERWIDVYENVGKRSGAYSAGARIHPFVLLNHKDTLNCEFTLAHEMGHAIHSYLSNKTQPVVYSDYVIFVAEVASTCNESLLMRHLLKNCSDKKLRAYLVNHFLEQFRTTFYRQAMFAEFELAINEIVENGGSLTADKLCEMYHQLNVDYYGEDFIVDSELDVEWARIPHFYYNYYVYQYATGFLAAIALSERILNEGASAVKDYIGFLSGGCSKDPISLLKDAGVDMTSEEPAKNAMKLFNLLLDEMSDLIG
ncbi:MAG: oligoendopeptidase F [Oscillospiraceae bacterium]|nr:oligoendopeptidase F [Oscillospiraceae bacterium]